MGSIDRMLSPLAWSLKSGPAARFKAVKGSLSSVEIVPLKCLQKKKLATCFLRAVSGVELIEQAPKLPHGAAEWLMRWENALSRLCWAGPNPFVCYAGLSPFPLPQTCLQYAVCYLLDERGVIANASGAHTYYRLEIVG